MCFLRLHHGGGVGLEVLTHLFPLIFHEYFRSVRHVSLIYVFISSLVSTLLGWGREKVLLFVGLLTVETTITTSGLEEGVAVTNSNLDNVPIMWGTIINYHTCYIGLLRSLQ